jgi:hypothetical protein
MNGNNYLADTNSFIFLLDRHPTLQTLLEGNWHYSFITEIELLGKTGILDKEVTIVRELLAACSKVAHPEKINHIAISLRQKQRIKVPDALIAATAIYHKLPLITFDKGAYQDRVT